MRVATRYEIEQCAAEARHPSCDTSSDSSVVAFLDPDVDTQALVLATLRTGGSLWKTGSPQSARLVWTTSLRADLSCSIQPGCVVNRFPWSFALTRKDEFYATLKDIGFPFLPQSFLIPAELSELRSTVDDLRASDFSEIPLWVMKPARSGGARKIKVFDSDGIVDAFRNNPKRPIIVQRYVPRLSLIDGRKFHLRVYALALEQNPSSGQRGVQVMVYQEGIAMIASERFDLSSRSSFVHVTNSRVQYAEHVGTPPRNWLIQSKLREYIDARHGSGHFDALWAQVKAVLVASIWAVIDKFHFHEKSTPMANASPGRDFRCFQLIGADICVAKDFTEAWLLELNTVPALQAGLDRSGCRCEPELSLSAALVRDVLSIVFDEEGNRDGIGMFELFNPVSSRSSHLLRFSSSQLTSGCWSFLSACLRPSLALVGPRWPQIKPPGNETRFDKRSNAISEKCLEASLGEGESTSSNIVTLAKHAADAIANFLESHGGFTRVLHIGHSSLGENMQSLLPNGEFAHSAWMPASSDLKPLRSAGCGTFHCIVDDSIADRRTSSISSRLLKKRCVEMTNLFQECGRLSLYIVFSWTYGAKVIGEFFDIVHSGRLHLDESVLWMHVSHNRKTASATSVEAQSPRPEDRLSAWPIWAKRPGVLTSLDKLEALLLHPDSKFQWCQIPPPCRMGSCAKLDKVAPEVGLLSLRGIAQKPNRRSKVLIFLDLHGVGHDREACVQIKCDAEWLPSDMMLAVMRIQNGDLIGVDGIIIRRLHGGERANILALNVRSAH